MRNRNSSGAALVGISSLAALATALLFVTPASAQDRPDTAVSEVEDNEIVVTGSRISTAGFDAPTPTTVVSAAELRQAGRTDIAAALADLPQFSQTMSATTTNGSEDSGKSPANMRGLGAARTLVLINNRRYVSSNDLQTVPYSLVKRIDVVTGGASAAYGSGAVAGAINIILDDKLEGFKLGAEMGISSRGDGAKYLFEGAMGKSFAGGRGHFVVGADYLIDKGITPATSRPLVGDAGFFPNAEGKLYPVRGIRNSNRSEGGLINSGVLAGQTFNPDGTLRPFQYGIRSPGAPTSMIGGEGYTGSKYSSISAPIKRINAFARLSFDVADNLTLWAEGIYNRVSDDRPFFTDLGVNQLTLSADNPFLAQSIRDRLAAAGETSFTFGRALTDVAFADFRYYRESFQASVGFDGSFGDGKWRYNGFYGHGEQKQDEWLTDLTLRTEFANALDAVRGPGGSVVCRVALADPSTPCRPLNLFGLGNADPAAIDYATADWNNILDSSLDSAGLSINGELLELRGRPVSVAAGVEYRKETFQSTFDAYSLANRFNMTNGTNVPKVSSDVKEAFAEINVPVLSDLPFIQELNLNGAVRISDYSRSGSIWSWKVGGIWDITNDIKLRATRSRDIRAASMTEMFAVVPGAFSTVIDLGLPGNPSTRATLFAGGNPDLQPEIADTLTIGGVISPLRGLTLSADWYDVKIRNAIVNLNAQQIVNRCYQEGDQRACNQITRDDTGAISQIDATFINIARYRNRGIDFEASYRTGLTSIGLPGQLSVRALANYLDTLISDNGVTVIQSAGYLVSGIPKWRGLLSATYESAQLGADIRTRYVDGGGYSPANVNPNRVEGLNINSRVYVDLGLRAYVGDKKRLTLSASIQNLFDRAPAIAANSPYLDLVGRYFSFGARVSF